MILIRSLHPAGEYSRSLVIPKQWFVQVGQPQKVKIVVGRRRLVIYAAEVRGDGNAKKRGTEAD